MQPMVVNGVRTRKCYQASALLARAGEGAVYHVQDYDNTLIKIFENLPEPDAVAKLELLSQWSSRPNTIAFPSETVADPTTSRVVGFVQPYFAKAIPLTRLMDSASRHAIRFPNDLLFRIKLCRFMADAFTQLHAIHLVMGDVSDSNFLIGRDWLGRLKMAYIIDCNSFQVTVRTNKGNECYPSGVATEEYAAPEVQPTDWSKSLRSVYSDSFGFAVLAWKLLFNGAHPFSVVTPRHVDVPPLGQRIEKRQFPFHPGTSLPSGWTTPPLDPSLAILPANIRQHFFVAFSAEDPRDRPLLCDWQKAFIDWEKELTPSLPWWLLQQFHQNLFPKVSLPQLALSRSTFIRLFVILIVTLLWLVVPHLFRGRTAETSPQQRSDRSFLKPNIKPVKRPSAIDPELFPHFPWNHPSDKE